MITKIFSYKDINKIIYLFKKKKSIIAFPTETVYGLGTPIFNINSIKKIYKIKNRSYDNPLSLHISNYKMLLDYIDFIPKLVLKLINFFWPGPLTIILPFKKKKISSIITGNLNTVAFRMPNNFLTLFLINKLGFPIVGTSANISGTPSSTNIYHILDDFNYKIDGILNDEKSSFIGIESTVIGFNNKFNKIKILRPGFITKDMIKKKLSNVYFEKKNINFNNKILFPSLKYFHYLPKTLFFIINGNEKKWNFILKQQLNKNKKIGLFISKDFKKKINYNKNINFFLYDNVYCAAKKLFFVLRKFDKENIDIIFASYIKETGFGFSYMNRLKKAANYKIL